MNVLYKLVHYIKNHILMTSYDLKYKKKCARTLIIIPVVADVCAVVSVLTVLTVGVVAVVGDSVVNVVGELSTRDTHRHTHTYANLFKRFVKRNVKLNTSSISSHLVKYS